MSHLCSFSIEYLEYQTALGSIIIQKANNLNIQFLSNKSNSNKS